jgi:hypothetical protein
MTFIDYKSGIVYENDTHTYWKTLLEVFDAYIDHPESKFEGNLGQLRRKHLIIDKYSIIYIGKETNELEESEVVGFDLDNYTHYINWKEMFAKLNEADARKVGLPRRTFYDLKKKFEEGDTFSIRKKTIRKLREFFVYRF